MNQDPMNSTFPPDPSLFLLLIFYNLLSAYKQIYQCHTQHSWHYTFLNKQIQQLSTDTFIQLLEFRETVLINFNNSQLKHRKKKSFLKNKNTQVMLNNLDTQLFAHTCRIMMFWEQYRKQEKNRSKKSSSSIIVQDRQTTEKV